MLWCGETGVFKTQLQHNRHTGTVGSDFNVVKMHTAYRPTPLWQFKSVVKPRWHRVGHGNSHYHDKAGNLHTATRTCSLKPGGQKQNLLSGEKRLKKLLGFGPVWQQEINAGVNAGISCMLGGKELSGSECVESGSPHTQPVGLKAGEWSWHDGMGVANSHSRAEVGWRKAAWGERNSSAVM